MKKNSTISNKYTWLWACSRSSKVTCSSVVRGSHPATGCNEGSWKHNWFEIWKSYFEVRSKGTCYSCKSEFIGAFNAPRAFSNASLLLAVREGDSNNDISVLCNHLMHALYVWKLVLVLRISQSYSNLKVCRSRIREWVFLLPRHEQYCKVHCRAKRNQVNICAIRFPISNFDNTVCEFIIQFAFNRIQLRIALAKWRYCIT